MNNDELFILVPTTPHRLPEERCGAAIQKLFDLGVNATAFFVPSHDIAAIYQEYQLQPENNIQAAAKDLNQQLKEHVPAAYHALFPQKTEVPPPVSPPSRSENDDTEEDTDSGVGAEPRSLGFTPPSTRLKRKAAQTPSATALEVRARVEQQLNQLAHQQQQLKPTSRLKSRDNGLER